MHFKKTVQHRRDIVMSQPWHKTLSNGAELIQPKNKHPNKGCIDGRGWEGPVPWIPRQLWKPSLNWIYRQ